MLKNSIRNKLIVLLMITTIIPFGCSIMITIFVYEEFNRGGRHPGKQQPAVEIGTGGYPGSANCDLDSLLEMVPRCP
ncbi:hypothetical protein [Bacillus sp. AK031]